ncbi:MAG: hypothetical protein HY360_10290, partial [Verrucomicrobia bacterium]|nr:hypothetical protein [Verrucomicrobiota bacterium]
MTLACMGLGGWTEASAQDKMQNDLRIPILLNKPASLATRTWPVTTGVPFKKGEFRDVADLTVVDQAGKPIPCQIVKTAAWEDGSLRWTLVDFNAQFDQKYFLTKSAAPEAKDDIKIKESPEGITLEAGGAQYVFRKGDGCFDALSMDLNGDGKFEPDEAIVSGAGGAFYVVDSQGRRGVLKGNKLEVELNGKRHTVVRLEGEYRDHPSQGDPARDEKGARNAVAVIYFHFYAGSSQVRISHKLIVTENTNELWFRDIGLNLPLKMDGATKASFNNDHDKPQSVFKSEIRNP